MSCGSTGQAFTRPRAKGGKLALKDLFETPLEQAEIDFENEGGDVYLWEPQAIAFGLRRQRNRPLRRNRPEADAPLHD